jgi:hypothetical protein
MAKVKIYVCYRNYGDYEGCSAPELVTFVEKEADDWQLKYKHSGMTDCWEVEQPDVPGGTAPEGEKAPK